MTSQQNTDHGFILKKIYELYGVPDWDKFDFHVKAVPKKAARQVTRMYDVINFYPGGNLLKPVTLGLTTQLISRDPLMIHADEKFPEHVQVTVLPVSPGGNGMMWGLRVCRDGMKYVHDFFRNKLDVYFDDFERLDKDLKDRAGSVHNQVLAFFDPPVKYRIYSLQERVTHKNFSSFDVVLDEIHESPKTYLITITANDSSRAQCTWTGVPTKSYKASFDLFCSQAQMYGANWEKYFTEDQLTSKPEKESSTSASERKTSKKSGNQEIYEEYMKAKEIIIGNEALLRELLRQCDAKDAKKNYIYSFYPAITGTTGTTTAVD